jgi:hypothetical protein
MCIPLQFEAGFLRQEQQKTPGGINEGRPENLAPGLGHSDYLHGDVIRTATVFRQFDQRLARLGWLVAGHDGLDLVLT